MDEDGVDVSVFIPSDHRRVASPHDRTSQVRARSNDFFAETVRRIVHQGWRNPPEKSAVRAILLVRPERRATLVKDDGVRAIAEELADLFELY